MAVRRTPEQRQELDLTDQARVALATALTTLIADLGAIRIGEPGQFPYGWRKAAKGRTVWRLVEEAIVQGLEAHASDLGLHTVTPAESEVGVYDVAVVLSGDGPVSYVNIKSAVDGGRAQRDDISKAESLHAFFSTHAAAQLYLATIYMHFLESNGSLLVALQRCHVTPVAWIPDIYVNPSNNGNLQSTKYRDPSAAVPRTSPEFVEVLTAAIAVADAARAAKRQGKSAGAK